MNKLASNKFVYWILAAIGIIAVSILMLSEDKKAEITPNVENTDSLSLEQMQNIKEQYEQDGKLEEFEIIYNSIEQAVANKFLDGSITSEEQLKTEINKINGMFKTSDWGYLNLKYPTFWIGNWNLDNKGKLYFTFSNANIKPSWIEELKMKECVK